MLLFLTIQRPVCSQTTATNSPHAYLLLNGSFLVDDCPVCARPTIPEPLRGTFNLRLLETNPLFDHYAVEDINFTAGSRPYTVKGSGTFQIGGEVALVQQMFLQVQIDDGVSNRLCFLSNTSAAVDRFWPMIHLTLDQTNGTLTQVYQLCLAAAPVREIWFSTANGLTSAFGHAPTNRVSGGDLISMSGRVVKRHHKLIGRLGIMPVAPDLGLDALDVLPGGEIAFSVEQDIFSERLGPLQHGDLVSDRGRILRRNQNLLAPFLPQPPVPDVGLDAVQVLDNGEILFSIEQDIFSEGLGVTLRRGDLLSSTGEVRRSHSQLLARFHPPEIVKDYGLDALYVWPHGENWFSLEEGFQDQVLGPIQPGDLLSDAGYVVFRNLELLNAFAPVEDLADFGLDALFIVTDVTPPAPAPQFLSIQANRSTRSIELAWEGKGRVFQIERASVVADAFQPFSFIIPDLTLDDRGALTNRAQSFYRLRQW